MRPLLLLIVAGAVFAQGTTPKEKPEDYPVHAQARSAGLGAEFMVHSFSGGQETYIVKGFLVVEVALYPREGRTVDVSSGNFMLRMNGRKQEMLPQPPSIVATTLAHPEWDTPPHLEADVGMGGTSVGIGHPRPTQIPGLPTPGQRNPPPSPDKAAGIPHEEKASAQQVLLDTALPQGEHRGPVSGFLYFTYSGKTSSIKSLELTYEDAVLKLR